MSVKNKLCVAVHYASAVVLF